MNTLYRKNLPGTLLDYVDARAAVEHLRPGAWAEMPYTARVHAENIVRKADPAQQDGYLLQLIERRRERDFPWFPARVVCHDILGQTALVDLAGLRDAIAAEGGDPAQVNPVVPVQLIVDHSLAVECGGFDPDAFAKNRAIEDRRNEDRFHFIEWTKKAFANVDVIPAGNGIMHQINLEKMSPVVYVQDGVAFPDTCVGTDSHTPHVDALGVIAVGVGGLEAENVMLGRASWMRLPDIVGVRLSLARIEPEGQVVRMWEAIETYLNRRQPLIVIAGADYGQGSSRDLAAKGVRLAGVEVVVAEGFERIHRTNLIGMGVLPLEFQPGTTRHTLQLDGTETFDVAGALQPRAVLSLMVRRKNGEVLQVPVQCRLDTAEEASVYEAGGVLQRFAQDFLAKSASSAPPASAVSYEN